MSEFADNLKGEAKKLSEEFKRQAEVSLVAAGHTGEEIKNLTFRLIELEAEVILFGTLGIDNTRMQQAARSTRASLEAAGAIGAANAARNIVTAGFNTLLKTAIAVLA